MSDALPRILFAGANDWANFSNRVARGINAAAGERVARVWTLNKHPFGYDEDMVASEASCAALPAWANSATWLLGTGDGDHQSLEAVCRRFPHLRRARRASLYIGSAYRGEPQAMHDYDRKSGAGLRFVSSDSLHLADGAIPTLPALAPVEAALSAVAALSLPIRIGHAPSDRTKKGTALILAALQDVPGIELDLIEGVRHAECLLRMQQCHILVDQIEASIGGFGAAATEALASGCAVLADIRHVPADGVGQVPRPPILDVRDASQLRAAVTALVADPTRLHAARQASLAWAQQHATPLAVGRWWLDRLATPRLAARSS